jgi:hypothetical protein
LDAGNQRMKECGVNRQNSRRRGRIVKAAVAAGVAVAASGAYFVSQASADSGTQQLEAQLGSKQVMLYTDSKVSCAWVGTGGVGKYISTGNVAAWRPTGVQVTVGATATVKTYTADCGTVQNPDGGDYASTHLMVLNMPSNLANFWVNVDSPPSGTVDVSSSSMSPSSSNFVMFSNRSGLDPFVCLSAWYAWAQEKSTDSNPANDIHSCKRLGPDKHVVFWLHNWPTGSIPHVHLSVNTTGINPKGMNRDFDPDPNSASCYRETSSGSVHQVTNQPCTSS